MAMSTFNVGDRVYYVSGNHGKADSNPLRGSTYECQGTVRHSEHGSISVLWDNGNPNSYVRRDLVHVEGGDSGKPNPNFAFSMKKRKLKRR